MGRALAIVAVLAQLASPALAEQLTGNDWRQRNEDRARTQIELVTGPVKQPCGVRWLVESTPRTAENFFPRPDERDVASAVQCVTAAQRAGQVTWALWQRSGFDSVLFGGLASTPSGEILLLHYDSIGPPELTTKPCPRPRADPASNVAVSCDAQ